MRSSPTGRSGSMGRCPLLALPTDRPRPPQQTFSGAQERRLLPRRLVDALEALSREQGATLFMTLLAAFLALLSRLSGQDDILVGTPIAGRNRAETEDLIGFFVNTLVIRGDLSGNPTFRDFLGRVRERSLEAYAHQDLPFEKLVEQLHPERDLAHPPLFQVMFAFENYPIAFPKAGGLSIENVEFETQVSNFDLTLDMALQEKGLGASIEFNTDLFDRPTVRRWLENLEVMLEGIAADPDRRISELPILTPAERERLLVTWNATAAEFPGRARACIRSSRRRSTGIPPRRPWSSTARRCPTASSTSAPIGSRAGCRSSASVRTFRSESAWSGRSIWPSPFWAFSRPAARTCPWTRRIRRRGCDSSSRTRERRSS